MLAGEILNGATIEVKKLPTQDDISFEIRNIEQTDSLQIPGQDNLVTSNKIKSFIDNE